MRHLVHPTGYEFAMRALHNKPVSVTDMRGKSYTLNFTLTVRDDEGNETLHRELVQGMLTPHGQDGGTPPSRPPDFMLGSVIQTVADDTVATNNAGRLIMHASPLQGEAVVSLPPNLQPSDNAQG